MAITQTVDPLENQHSSEHLGSENPAHNKPSISVRDPQDGSLVGTVPALTANEIDTMLDNAVTAAQQMRQLPVYTRAAVLNSVATAVSEQREDFARLIAREGIKTLDEARREAARCADTLRLSAAETQRLSGETIAFDQVPGGEQRFGYYRRIPLGVITAITPYNDPLNLVAHKIGPALAAGNALLLKPHMETPLSALHLVELFQQTALPPFAVQLVTGHDADIGDRLIADPRVAMVSFTGGLTSGENIQRRIGIKKIAMELGSNCACIVMGDADFSQALDACVSGAFAAAGQNCLHVQRIFIQEAVYQKFRDAFVQRASTLRLGDKLDETTDMGPMINESAALRVDALVRDAIEKGATLLCGGQRRGNWYLPTVLENISDRSALAREEVFGPVTLLYPFKDISEAVVRSNDTPYGLQAGIFTRDLNQAFAVADALHCGGVMINDSSDYRIDAMPFGGVKNSGLGREGVSFAVREMSELKTYCFNLESFSGGGE